MIEWCFTNIFLFAQEWNSVTGEVKFDISVLTRKAFLQKFSFIDVIEYKVGTSEWGSWGLSWVCGK